MLEFPATEDLESINASDDVELDAIDVDTVKASENAVEVEVLTPITEDTTSDTDAVLLPSAQTEDEAVAEILAPVSTETI